MPNRQLPTHTRIWCFINVLAGSSPDRVLIVGLIPLARFRLSAHSCLCLSVSFVRYEQPKLRYPSYLLDCDPPRSVFKQAFASYLPLSDSGCSILLFDASGLQC